MDLIMLYKALMRKKWYLIIIPIIAAVIAIYLTRDFKSMFKSTAQLSTGFTVSEQVSVTEERFNIFQADIKFNNLREIITSQKVFGLISYKLLLHDLNGKLPPYREIRDSKEKSRIFNAISKDEIIKLLENKIDSLTLVDGYNDRERKILDLLKLYEYDYRSLRKILTVFRVEGTDYLQLVAQTEKATLSADMVNILCEQFFRYYNYQQADKAGASINSFRKLAQQKEKELQEAEEALRAFRTENGIINLDAASESKIGQITDLTNDKEEETQNIRAIKLELDKVKRELSKYAQGSGPNNAEILKIRNKLTQLRRKSLEPGASQAIQDSIDYYSDRMAANTNRGSNIELITKKEDLETRLDIAEEHLSSLNRRLYQLNSAIGTSANIQAKLSNLEREVTRASDEYLSAQEKYNTAQDLASVNLGAMRQIIFGQPATDPEPSKRIIITGLSGAASFVFCLIIIILLEYIDVSIKSPYNFHRIYEHTNLLGTLNKVKLNKKLGVAQLMSTEGKKQKKYQKQFRELLRKIRFEINNSDKKIILFTSNKEGEGKTVLIEAMSRAVSITLKKVLIIDINFSNPQLTELFSANPVLEEITSSGDNKFDPTSHLTTSDVENIDIIGCTGGDYTPSELMDFDKFSAILDAVKDSYDFIFIESAALNYHTDTKELVEYADGVISVCSAESVSKELDKESMSFLHSLGDKFLGVVLNKVKSENINQ